MPTDTSYPVLSQGSDAGSVSVWSLLLSVTLLLAELVAGLLTIRLLTVTCFRRFLVRRGGGDGVGSADIPLLGVERILFDGMVDCANGATSATAAGWALTAAGQR